MNIDWHESYCALQAPCAAQVQHVAQSAGAVQSMPPSLDEALDFLSGEYAVQMPTADLLYSSPTTR